MGFHDQTSSQPFLREGKKAWDGVGPRTEPGKSSMLSRLLGPSDSLPYLLWFFPKWAREAASWQGPHLEFFIVFLFVSILGDFRIGSQFCLHATKLVVGETWDSLWPGIGSCFTPVTIEWCWSLQTFPCGTYRIVISSKVGHASPGASLLVRNAKIGATGSWGHGKIRWAKAYKWVLQITKLYFSALKLWFCKQAYKFMQYILHFPFSWIGTDQTPLILILSIDKPVSYLYMFVCLPA